MRVTESTAISVSDNDELKVEESGGARRGRYSRFFRRQQSDQSEFVAGEALCTIFYSAAPFLTQSLQQQSQKISALKRKAEDTDDEGTPPKKKAASKASKVIDISMCITAKARNTIEIS